MIFSFEYFGYEEIYSIIINARVKVDLLYCLRPELQKMILERLDEFRRKNEV